MSNFNALNMEMIKFITKLTEEEQLKLYENEVVCYSLFQSFDENTKKVIFELISRAVLLIFLKKHVDFSIVKLLKILNLIEKKEHNIFLNNSFRKGLIKSFTLQNHAKICKISKLSNSIDIYAFSKTKFQNILNFIVGKSKQINFEIENFLNHIEMINNNFVTSKGFNFLLKNKKEQFWELILEKIEMFGINSKLFLFEFLCALNYQKAYFENCNEIYEIILNNKSGVENQLLAFLDCFDIIYYKKNKLILKPLFFSLFTNDFAIERQFCKKEKYLIIESNFKFYAYTSSTFNLCILRLFALIKLELPHLKIGIFNEESLNLGFDKGLKGNQIISYLKTNTRKGFENNNLYKNILIWEKRRERFISQKAFVYTNFNNINDYLLAKKFAQQNSSLIKCIDNIRLIVIKESGHKSLKEYLKNK